MINLTCQWLHPLGKVSHYPLNRKFFGPKSWSRHFEKETHLLWDPNCPTPSLVIKPIEVTHMKGHSGWLTLHSVHLSHSHSLNSSKREACRHRCMKAQTKKQTPSTCFIFFFALSIIRFFVGNMLKQMILCVRFKLCNEKTHDLCSVLSQQLMPKHDNGPHLIQHYKTDKQFSSKL